MTRELMLGGNELIWTWTCEARKRVVGRWHLLGCNCSSLESLQSDCAQSDSELVGGAGAGLDDGPERANLGPGTAGEGHIRGHGATAHGHTQHGGLPISVPSRGGVSPN